MKTIAIDIRLLGKKRTGDETVFFHLTKNLLALDKENTYYLMTDIMEDEKKAILRGQLGCVGQENVHFISLWGKNRFVWNLLTLPWFLITHSVHIYHTQYILPFFVPKRTKVVTHIHDVSFAAYPKLIGFSDRMFLSLLIPRSLKRAALIITPSQFTKDEIIKYYSIDPEKIVIVPNALGESFYSSAIPSQEKIASVREKYHLPEKFLLYVGTFQPRKNIPFLIQAAFELEKRLPEMKLVLVGSRTAHHVDTALESTLTSLDMANNVFFPGYVAQDDLPTLVHVATVFAFPSLYEGFGIPLLEAMSQGVPVASSNIPCLQEVGGEAALYFDPRSLASCVEKLYTLSIEQGQREELVRKGKERLSLFSWEKSAKILLQKYNTLF